MKDDLIENKLELETKYKEIERQLVNWEMERRGWLKLRFGMLVLESSE